MSLVFELLRSPLDVDTAAATVSAESRAAVLDKLVGLRTRCELAERALLNVKTAAPAAAGLLTSEQVATILDVPVRSVHELCRTKRLPAFKVGKLWRIKRADFEQWKGGAK